jgi:NAD(P)-dependent dehydrogenase (short-subunit alcohol dehydrogenase family)
MRIADIFDVRGHVVFVTGAASGLGLAFAEAFAENGARVTLADINAANLEQQATRLRAGGCDVETALVDVCDADKLKAAIAGAAQRHGRLDAVFANAGISSGPGFSVEPSGELANLDMAIYRRVIDINLTAVLDTIRFAAEPMKRQKRGSIVATSSIAGLHAEAHVGYPYVVAKAAVNNLVKQAALELAPHNVRVNAIAPGPFFTNIRDGFLYKNPDAVARFAATVPMGRLAKTDEIKGLALLLGSAAGSFITGAVIPIDGGSMAGT